MMAAPYAATATPPETCVSSGRRRPTLLTAGGTRSRQCTLFLPCLGAGGHQRLVVSSRRRIGAVSAAQVSLARYAWHREARLALTESPFFFPLFHLFCAERREVQLGSQQWASGDLTVMLIPSLLPYHSRTGSIDWSMCIHVSYWQI
jgi:hypothetical protein